MSKRRNQWTAALSGIESRKIKASQVRASLDDVFGEQQDSKKPKTNKYNAEAVEVDGVRYDSKFESQVAAALQVHGIPYQHQYSIEIAKTVQYREDEAKLSKRRFTADFFLPEHNIVLDSKGATITDAWRIRADYAKRTLAAKLPMEQRPFFCIVYEINYIPFILAIKTSNKITSELLEPWRLTSKRTKQK